MTLEMKSSAYEARPASHSVNAGAKSKAAGAGKPDAGAPGGFMAALAAVEDGSDATETPSTSPDAAASLPVDTQQAAPGTDVPEVDPASKPDVPVPSDTGLMMAQLQEQSRAQQAQDAQAASSTIPVADAAAMLAQSLAQASGKTEVASTKADTPVSGVAALAAQSLRQAQARAAMSAKVPAEGQKPGADVPTALVSQAESTLSPAEPGAADLPAAKAVRPQVPSASALAPQAATSSATDVAKIPPLEPAAVSMRRMNKAQPDTLTDPGLQGLATGVSTNGQADPKATALLQRAESATANTSPPEIVLAAAVAPARREAVTGERTLFKEVKVDVAPGVPQAQVGFSIPSSPEVVTGTPLEAAVAEQVKYWISNDVQNAEMKLDGLGSSPVEVSISMHGNEAHVAFRTDELQAREALENASGHLKEMLRGEGLNLSAVSVNSSGAGESGAQERKFRQSARQGVMSIAPRVSNESASALSRSSGRKLDLFV